jgi:hypothetical protein
MLLGNDGDGGGGGGGGGGEERRRRKEGIVCAPPCFPGLVRGLVGPTQLRKRNSVSVQPL